MAIRSTSPHEAADILGGDAEKQAHLVRTPADKASLEFLEAIFKAQIPRIIAFDQHRGWFQAHDRRSRLVRYEREEVIIVGKGVEHSV
jgi:hypothetical protein